MRTEGRQKPAEFLIQNRGEALRLQAVHSHQSISGIVDIFMIVEHLSLHNQLCYTTPVMATCFHCGNSLEGPVFRSTICESCGKDVKVCLNCEFYSPGSHWDCHETVPEQVKDKDRANFCDYFRLSSKAGGPAKGKKKADDARNAFDTLFGGE